VHYLAYSAGADYSRRISRRMSVVTTYNYDVRESVSGGTNGFRRHSVRGRLTRDIGRGLGVYAGYGYSHARFEGADDEFTHHNIDVGVDFTRSLSLSLSRRTLLSFSTGTAAYRNLAGAFRFRATGSARLSHEMGRTWNASLAYNRGLSFVETWREPVFIDSAVAGVGGMLSRRAQLQFTARALLGGSNSGSYGDAESVSATGGLTVALTRHVSTGLTYVYYRQQFADTLLLAEGFPHEFSGQSIRASVSVWAPLFQRARRP
jgi:opacity protein-like surface antigen